MKVTSSHFTHPMPSLRTDVQPCVATGQQIGLFGGPLYTLLKICSARAAANELSQQTGQHIRTVFWLEDNDHDAKEASLVSIPSGKALVHASVWNGTHDRIPVSQRAYTQDEVEAIHELLDLLDGRYAEERKPALASLYQVGKPWADAFLELLDPYLSAWNVSVVRGSDVTKSGAHTKIVERDLREGGELERTIEKTTKSMMERGFDAQANVPDVLFFLHDDEGRQRLIRDGNQFRTTNAVYELDQLLEILHTTPQRFSPSVLARPFVQDTYLGTIASVLGPAEIAYHAQLVDAYRFLGIEQPLCLARHHATLLDPRSERLLEKSGKEAQWFYRTWEEIEHEAVGELTEQFAVPHAADADVNGLIAAFRDAATRIEPTLVKTADATGASITGSLEVLEAKLRSAVKKSSATVMDRLEALWQSIYPEGKFSERVYPIALWESRLGVDALRIIVESICSQPRNTITVMGPSDIVTRE